MYCYIPMPLDLHVLSLPLAFILSQDQTLHCKIFVLLDSILLFQITYYINIIRVSSFLNFRYLWFPLFQ